MSMQACKVGTAAAGSMLALWCTLVLEGSAVSGAAGSEENAR